MNVKPADPDTLAQLGWGQVLADLARRCRTVPGAEHARRLDFLPDADTARARMAEIEEARQLAMAGTPVALSGVVDVAEIIQRAAKGSALEPAELIAVAETARGCDRLRVQLTRARERAPRLAERAAPIADLGHVFHPILDAFDEAGALRDHASDALGPLRKQAARARAELDRRAQELLDDPRLADALQDRFFTQRDDRCVLPVKVEARWRVRGIVHGTSHSGQTAFVEPEALVEPGNQLVLAHHAVTDEERRILTTFTGYVAEDAAALQSAQEVAAHIDVLAAAADQAEALVASPPRLGEAVIELVRARHPLMELSGRRCVPNDVRLPVGAGLVLSGPNAGGKTVALKTTGLAVLMARAGLPIAAAGESALPWVECVLSDIGDAQSLDKDLSTFSGHLLRVHAVLAAARPGTLVLFDELAVGTEPEQGAALAQAVLETLVERGATVLVTTHYERLKALGASDPRFSNASVGFDLERMSPTFELHLGVPGSSGALGLARRLEVDAQVIDRAEGLLGEGRAGVEQLIAALTAERERLSEQRDQLAAAEREAERKAAAADRARAAAVEREQRARHASHDEAVTALRDARRELDELKLAVKRRRREAIARASGGASEEVGWLGAEVDAAAARIAAHAPQRDPGAGSAPPDPAELRPGVQIRVLSLGAVGEVAAPAEGNRVSVQIGSLRSTVPVGDVRVLSGRERRHQARAVAALARSARADGSARRSFEVVAAPNEGRALVRTPDTTVDLRGQRVDEALAELDRFVDESLRRDRETIFVIHGHGTGALRNAVRERLRAHPAVSQFRPGEPNEGGDGVTVAWL